MKKLALAATIAALSFNALALQPGGYADELSNKAESEITVDLVVPNLIELTGLPDTLTLDRAFENQDRTYGVVNFTIARNGPNKIGRPYELTVSGRGIGSKFILRHEDRPLLTKGLEMKLEFIPVVGVNETIVVKKGMKISNRSLRSYEPIGSTKQNVGTIMSVLNSDIQTALDGTYKTDITFMVAAK